MPTERPGKQALQGEIVVPSLGLPCLGERFPGWCAGLPGRTFWTTYGKCQLRAVCRLGPFGAGGLPTAHWSVCMWGVPGGCIMSGGDILWVSLCVPMRPGKNSFVARLRIRMPRGPMPRVLSLPALSVHAGFADARLHYLAPCNGGSAACALSPANLGSADVYA